MVRTGSQCLLTKPKYSRREKSLEERSDASRCKQHPKDRQEAKRLELRGEFFNVANSAHVGRPDLTINWPQVGRITSTDKATDREDVFEIIRETDENGLEACW